EHMRKQSIFVRDMSSSELAWNIMLAKLEKEMPAITASGKRGKEILFHNNTIYFLVLLLLWMNIKHTNNTPNTQKESIHIAEASRTNKSISKLQNINQSTTSVIYQHKSTVGNN